jgi:hypothetical protein
VARFLAIRFGALLPFTALIIFSVGFTLVLESTKALSDGRSRDTGLFF